MIKQSFFMKIYLIPLLVLSPYLTMSCNSWFSIWLMLELNLMTFIPMIIIMNKFYKEISMKYFLIQAFSSSMLIISSNMYFITFNDFFSLMIWLINLSLFMKIGTVPFHTWFINMMKNLSWLSCLILSTWQKIIPMMLLMYIYSEFMIYLISIFSALMGSLMGLNHLSMRIIMAYSSINHMSWMLINITISELMWMLYFFSYSIINLSIMYMFHKLNIFFMTQLFNVNSLKISMYMYMNLLSITGLPPMFGFIFKWLSIYFYSLNYMYLINLIIMMLTILSFVYYIRLSMSFLLVISLMNKLILINKFFKSYKVNVMIIVIFMLNFWIISIWVY